MVLNKLSIRWKITLSNILLLTIISLMLFIGSNNSADRVIKSIPMTQIADQTDQGTGDLADSSVPDVQVQFPLQAAKNTHRTEMGMYMIATILLGGLATFVITKRAMKQLEEVERRIKATDTSKLSEKIVIRHPEPEIACLLESFNNMTNKLEESFALQKQFSHSMAHELRTPLTVIRTKIEVFKKKNRTPEEYHALLELMQRYTENLSDMVENILQYSDLSHTPVQDHIILDDMLLQVVSEISGVYAEPLIQLDVGGCACTGNAMLLRRVFSNLVENACRYGQGGDGIHISVTKRDADVIIRISDNGIGINDFDKAHIFEPFYRVDKSRSREFGGTGLGLFFCKEIISRHGGTITVCDHKPSGTTFTITLPA